MPNYSEIICFKIKKMEPESQPLDFEADDENAVNDFAKEVDHLKCEMD